MERYQEAAEGMYHRYSQPEFRQQDASRATGADWAILIPLALIPALIFSIMRSRHNARVDQNKREMLALRASIVTEMADIHSGKRR